MKRIGVLINPYAKMIRKKKVYLNDFYALDKSIVNLKTTVELDEVDAIVHDFKNEQVSCIAIVGGDGTIHQILTKLIKIYENETLPPLLILKGGTMNLVSESLRVKGTAIQILERLVEAIKENKEIDIQKRDTIKINDRYCFLFGLGVVTNYLNEVYKEEKGALANIRGFFTAIEHSIHEPEENSIFEGIKGDVYLDGKLVYEDFVSAILAGTVEYISHGMPALKKATSEKGKFHIIMTNLTKFALLKHLYMVFGVSPYDENIISTLVSTVRIEAKQPFQYTMDGDLYESDGKLNIEVGPRIQFVNI